MLHSLKPKWLQYCTISYLTKIQIVTKGMCMKLEGDFLVGIMMDNLSSFGKK